MKKKVFSLITAASITFLLLIAILPRQNPVLAEEQYPSFKRMGWEDCQFYWNNILIDGTKRICTSAAVMICVNEINCSKTYIAW